MKNIFWIVLIVSFFASASLPAASRNSLFHQGVVFDTDGNPLSGTLDVTFRIYDDLSASEALWTDTQSLNFESGVFTAELGASTPFPDDLFDKESLYLGVQISDDDEMSPRLTLFSVPWSQQAEVATTALSLADNIVTSQSIAPGAIESTNIAAGAVGANELASTAVTPGTYTLSTITVDQDGRIIAASNGSAGSGGDITGVITGAGLTGGGTSGDVTLSVVLGTTVESSEITNLDAAKLTGSVDDARLSTNVTKLGQTIESVEITDGTITSSDISGTAGITDAQINDELTISGGTINNTVIGGVTPAAGTFSTLNLNDTNLVLDADNVGAGANQAISFNRGSDNANDARLLWDESNDLFKVLTDGTALARLQAASPSAADDVATKAYVDGATSSFGDITAVTAGTGLTGGGTSGSVTLNAALGDTVESAEVTSLDAVKLTGSVADARLSANVSLLGSAIESAEVTSLDAAKLTGSVADTRLSANVSLLGSAIESAEVTSLDAAKLTGSVADARLSANVSLLGSSIDSSEITNDTIVDTDINSSAAIAWSKISKTGAVAGDVGAASSSHTHAASDVTGTITDPQVSDTLTASIVKGSGSSTDAVDLGTGEVAGTLALANLTDSVTTTDALFAGGAGGDPAYRAIADADVPNTITIDLAATATALAANGTNCSAGSYALGVDASGNAEGCTAAAGGLPNVVNVTDTTSQSLTDADELITDSNPSITPSSVDSRIMVSVSINIDADANDDEVNVFKVWRNSSCSGTQVGGNLKTFTTATAEFAAVSATFVDSPATTSVTTYVLCHDNDATGTISNDTVTVTITLTEIAQ